MPDSPNRNKRESLSVYPTSEKESSESTEPKRKLPHEGNNYGFTIKINKAEVVDTAVKSIIGGVATGLVLRGGKE